MPRNGSGTFNRIYSWVTDASNGLDIDSTRMDSDTNDIGSALTQSIAYDGQTVPIANLPMGGYRHTGVGSGVAPDDYAALGQLQTNAATYCGTAGGTGDAITITPSPAITAYAAGQSFSFIASAANTTATTINVNGVGVVSIKRNDLNALEANDIKSGQLCQVEYDGTEFQLANRFVPTLRGNLLAVQVFTSTGTYTPTASATTGIAHLVGAGGSGGGAPIPGSAAVSCGGGGGSGPYVVIQLTSLVSQSVTIGTGGAASNTTGNTGGSTIFEGLTLSGGAGGYSAITASSPNAPGGVGGAISGSVTHGSILYQSAGTKGQGGYAGASGTSPLFSLSGSGGNSGAIGGPGQGTMESGASNIIGASATGFGHGGSGANTLVNNVAAVASGAGASGILIIYEYS